MKGTVAETKLQKSLSPDDEFVEARTVRPAAAKQPRSCRAASVTKTMREMNETLRQLGKNRQICAISRCANRLQLWRHVFNVPAISGTLETCPHSHDAARARTVI